MLYLAPPFSSLSQYRFHFSELRFTCLMAKRIQYHIPKEYDIVTRSNSYLFYGLEFQYNHYTVLTNLQVWALSDSAHAHSDVIPV